MQGMRDADFAARDLAARARDPEETRYRAWVQKVDAATSRQGPSLFDLPDVPLRDWFEDGLSPSSAARRALQRAGAW